MSERNHRSRVDAPAEQDVEMRPAAMGLPNRAHVRQVRLTAQPGELLVRRAGRVVRRLTVGPDAEVASAVHVGGPLVREKVATFRGAVDLHGPSGERVARIDLSEWVPEFDDLLRPDEVLRRSGVKPLLEQAGLPLRPIPNSAVDEALRTTWDRIAPLRGLGTPFTVLRALAVALAATVGFTEMIGTAPAWLFVAAAAGLLLSTLVALGLWLRAALVGRVTDGGHPVFRPHPSVPVSRRFLRRARMRIEPDEVVLVNDIGVERRLPRSGRLAVTVAALVREGRPQGQVELRTATGTPRATLPWAEWCAGTGGREALEEVCAAGGLPVEWGAAPSARPAAEELMAREAHCSHSRRIVATRMTFPAGLPGHAAVWQTPVFAWILLVTAIFGPEAPVSTGWVAAAVLLLTLGLHGVRTAVGVWWLDRRVRPT